MEQTCCSAASENMAKSSSKTLMVLSVIIFSVTASSFSLGFNQSTAINQQFRVKLKILWMSTSARNKTAPTNIGMYELNAGAISIALKDARKTGLLDPNTTDVEIVYRDVTGANATKAMAHALGLNDTPGSFQLLLGPSDSGVARIVSFLMQAMHKVHIVWGATAPDLSDRTVHGNIIRPQQNYNLVGQCVAQFFRSQNMTSNIAMLYNDNIALCQFVAATLRRRAASFNVTISYYDIQPDTTDDQFIAVLSRISGESRIIFGCGMFEATNYTRNLQFYRIMAAAKKLGMTDSSYQWVMFMTDLARPRNHPLYVLETKNFPPPEKILRDNNIELTLAELAEAMKHVIYLHHRMGRRSDFVWKENVLAAITEPPWNENMTRVRADLQRIGINTTYASSAYISGHLADSITLYLRGVQIARAIGRDYTDPYAMYDILRNITFNGYSGYFAFNRDGERLPDLALHGPVDNYDAKPMQDKFEVKGTMRCSIHENIMSDSNKIGGLLELDKPFIWYTPDGQPPPGVPACGYRSELCGLNPMYLVLIIAASVAFLLLVGGITLWTATRRRRKAELLRMDWLLQADDIKESTRTKSFFNDGGSSRSSASNSSTLDVVNSISSDGWTPLAYNNIYATYQGAQVSLYKWSWTPSSNFLQRNFSVLDKRASGGDRNMLHRTASGGSTASSNNALASYVLEHRECLHELLAMRRVHHDNLCAFVGAYYQHDTRQLVFVHSYCHKGTLRRVIQRQSRLNQPLEWFFKQSILVDIALGLEHLQNSTQLEFHGRLSSHYVVIDSRWVTKITGFGRWSFGIEHPQDFLLLTSDETEDAEAYKRRLFWTAPEILRKPNTLSDACNFHHTSSTTTAARNAVAVAKEADVYSFGVIMSEAIYDIEPYSERLEDNGIARMSASRVLSEVMQMPKLAESPFRPHFGKDIAVSGVTSEEDVTARNACRRLMIRCWAEDGGQRPTAKTIAQSLRAQARARGGGRGTESLVSTVIAKLEIYAKNLESLVQARTKDLQEEKRRADKLLTRLLPEAIAEQLKRGETIVPQMCDSASVFFSDIVSFTNIASLLTPLAVVELLNGVFMYMDGVLSRYVVYKMETIGDGYMVVSGLPQRISTHADELASMALDIRNGLAFVKFDSLQQLPSHQNISIRSGLHSGPVVAGVVGLTMPRYCLFGDTVNVASRMESQGEAMQIQISESTRQLLGAEYIGRERGVVDIKGKGSMHTYWLDEGPTR